MQVIPHSSILAFLHKLDEQQAADIYRAIEVLRQRGATLAMPISKPIGKGLYELRTHGKPAFRVLYGFCAGEAILLVAMKKQKPSLDSKDIKTALARLQGYCGI